MSNDKPRNPHIHFGVDPATPGFDLTGYHGPRLRFELGELDPDEPIPYSPTEQATKPDSPQARPRMPHMRETMHPMLRRMALQLLELEVGGLAQRLEGPRGTRPPTTPALWLLGKLLMTRAERKLRTLDREVAEELFEKIEAQERGMRKAAEELIELITGDLGR